MTAVWSGCCILPTSIIVEERLFGISIRVQSQTGKGCCCCCCRLICRVNGHAIQIIIIPIDHLVLAVFFIIDGSHL